MASALTTGTTKKRKRQMQPNDSKKNMERARGDDIMSLPYCIHAKLARCLDDANWNSDQMFRNLLDFSAYEVEMIEVQGMMKGQSCTKILLKEMDAKGYSVEDLRNILKDIPKAKVAMQEIDEWLQPSNVCYQESQIKIQCPEHCAQERAGTSRSNGIIEKEPVVSSTKEPVEHTDDTAEATEPQQNDWCRFPEAVCEHIYVVLRIKL